MIFVATREWEPGTYFMNERRIKLFNPISLHTAQWLKVGCNHQTRPQEPQPIGLHFYFNFHIFPCLVCYCKVIFGLLASSWMARFLPHPFLSSVCFLSVKKFCLKFYTFCGNFNSSWKAYMKYQFFQSPSFYIFRSMWCPVFMWIVECYLLHGSGFCQYLNTLFYIYSIKASLLILTPESNIVF